MSIATFFSTIGVLLLVAGCSSVPIQPPTPTSTENTVFTDYRAVFRFIAEQERLPTDAGTLFRLAADSEIRVWCFDEMPAMYLVTARYYAGGIYDQIRGAQDNGRYYVLRTLARDFSAIGHTDRGFKLAGIADGNSYTWQTINHRPRLITRWHVSAAESSTNVYDWNGTMFQLVSEEER